MRVNGEKYADPTADTAIRNTEQEREKVFLVVKIIRLILRLAGLEIVNRIEFRSKASGRIWK